MIPVNKVYGGFILENLKNFDLILCGTITFSGVGKNIGELNYIMDRFKNDRLVKYRISSKCYWVVEKMGNNNNHIHLMIGLVRGYKNVDDYCKIFAGYWKNRGSCLFVEYDDEKGLFGDYMFKDLVEWDYFETKFDYVRNNNLFGIDKLNIDKMNMKFDLLNFVDLVENKIKNPVNKSVKDSVINYIERELNEILNNHPESDLKLKLTKGGKIKEVRCWGDIVLGERRFRLMCKNEKVYTSKEFAKKNENFKFKNTSKQCVIDTLVNIKEVFEKMENDDIELWYVKKDKINKTKNIISIHDK